MSELGRFRTSLTFLTADSGFPSPRSSIIDLTSSTNLWPTHLGFLGILKAVNFFETLWIAAAEAEWDSTSKLCLLEGIFTSFDLKLHQFGDGKFNQFDNFISTLNHNVV